MTEHEHTPANHEGAATTETPAAGDDARGAELVAERRALALRMYFRVDEVPYSAEAQERYGITGEGNIAEGGLTEAGEEFADQLVDEFDRQAVRHLASRIFDEVRQEDRKRQASEPTGGAAGTAVGLIHALGLRTAFRHALLAGARAFVAHLEHEEHGEGEDDEAPARDDDGEGMTVGIVGGATMRPEMREAIADMIRKRYGSKAKIENATGEDVPEGGVRVVGAETLAGVRLGGDRVNGMREDTRASMREQRYRRGGAGRPVDPDASMEAHYDAEADAPVVAPFGSDTDIVSPGGVAPGATVTTEYPSYGTPPADAASGSPGVSFSSHSSTSGDHGRSADASPSSAPTYDSPSSSDSASTGGTD